MRLMWLLPLTYVAGVHGFAIFAPYLAVFLASWHLLRRRRRNQVLFAHVSPAPQPSVTPTFQK